VKTKQVLRSITPPVLWESARGLRRSGASQAPAHVFQNVTLSRTMTRLYESPFSELHERYARLNRQIEGDENVTRMRTYFVAQLARLALQTTTRGAFLTAGVSFAVAPKVAAELVDFQATGRRWIMIDPFDGRGDARYNTDIAIAKEGWNSSIPTSWVQLPLLQAVEDSAVTSAWGDLAFLHLNTTDFASEFTAFTYLSSMMLPGALAVVDVYGWESPSDQQKMDRELSRLNLLSFELPTLQLVVMKPLVA